MAGETFIFLSALQRLNYKLTFVSRRARPFLFYFRPAKVVFINKLNFRSGETLLLIFGMACSRLTLIYF